MSNTWRVNVAIAAFALLLFHLVGMATGRVQERGGLGWDGSMYARMVSGKLSDGSPNTAVRPVVILAVRIPYRLGADIIRSFEAMNTAAAFVLYLLAALLLQRNGLDAATRAVVVANLPLTISASKMFSFYPALVDLGAMAIIATAFYLASTDRFRLAAATSVLAASSREFGLAAALYGLHRSARLGRWKDAALFLPAVIVPVLIRLPMLGLVPRGGAPLSLAKLFDNLRMWTDVPFVTAFAYFALTLLGGITVLLAIRLPMVIRRLRAEPELVTFAGFVIAATAVGDSDIPRYLVFVLPVAIVLVAGCLSDLPAEARARVLAVVTLITILTQRPLQSMTTDAYFLDWFPLYRVAQGAPVPADVLMVWMPRLLSLILAMSAAYMVVRHALHLRTVHA
jgi:hypothetical protein